MSFSWAFNLPSEATQDVSSVFHRTVLMIRLFQGVLLPHLLFSLLDDSCSQTFEGWVLLVSFLPWLSSAPAVTEMRWRELDSQCWLSSQEKDPQESLLRTCMEFCLDFFLIMPIQRGTFLLRGILHSSIWANIGRWWGIGKPGMLQSKGLHRVGTTTTLPYFSSTNLDDKWHHIHNQFWFSWIMYDYIRVMWTYQCTRGWNTWVLFPWPLISCVTLGNFISLFLRGYSSSPHVRGVKTVHRIHNYWRAQINRTYWWFWWRSKGERAIKDNSQESIGALASWIGSGNLQRK